MKNVKEQVYEALKTVLDNVSDIYPSDWVHLPAVQYVEEDNSVYERTKQGEQKARVRYRIDVWNGRSKYIGSSPKSGCCCVCAGAGQDGLPGFFGPFRSAA